MKLNTYNKIIKPQEDKVMFNNFNSNDAWSKIRPMGATYAAKPAAPKNTQPLTPDEQNELKTKAPKFTTQLSRVEILRSWCTHRTPQGLTLRDNGDGTATCTICGETIEFPQIPYTEEDVANIAATMNNTLNIIKCLLCSFRNSVYIP